MPAQTSSATLISKPAPLFALHLNGPLHAKLVKVCRSRQHSSLCNLGSLSHIRGSGASTTGPAMQRWRWMHSPGMVPSFLHLKAVLAAYPMKVTKAQHA